MNRIHIFFFLLLSITLNAQEKSKGFILSKSNDVVYLDYDSTDVKVGTVCNVLQEGGVFIHPVTKENIKQKDEIIATIQITAVYDKYSEGSCNPSTAIDKLKVGMKVFIQSKNLKNEKIIKKKIAIIPLSLIGAYDVYIGQYMADILVESLYRRSNDIKIFDRTTMKSLESTKILNDDEAVNVGRNIGVDYFITGIVENEVRESNSNMALKPMLVAAEMRMGSEFASDAYLKQLKSISNVKLKVIDVRSGEILFICSESQMVKGQSNVVLEQSVLGGGNINSNRFVQTVSGQASVKAINYASQYIVDKFNGKIQERSYIGNYVSFDGKQYTGSLTAMNESDSVYFFDPKKAKAPMVLQHGKFIDPSTNIKKGEILARFPNSGKIQIKAKNNNDTITYTVDENYVFPSDKSINYQLVNDVTTLSIGMKVYVFNGFEFTQGTVKKIGKSCCDISYEAKTKKGKTEFKTSSFCAQVLIPINNK